MPRPKGDPKNEQFRGPGSKDESSQDKGTKLTTLSPSEMGLSVNDYEVVGVVNGLAARTRGKTYDERKAAKHVYSASAAGTKQVAETARDEALKQLERSTSSHRNDALDKFMIVGVRFDSAQSEEGIVEVCAYGTLIRLER